MRKIILFIISVIAISAFAQTDYYYFKGQRIPLTVNPKKVNVISMANGPQFAPAVNPSILNDSLEIEAVIPGAQFNMCIIKSNSEDPTLLDSIISTYTRPDYNIILPCYINSRYDDIIPSGYIYVKLKKTQDYNLLENEAAKLHLTIHHQNIFMPKWYVLRINTIDALKLIEKANRLYQTGLFDAVEPDFMQIEDCCSISWDENVSLQWGLYNEINSTIDINVSSAWNYATGKGVKVGIFDSGIDWNHMDLKDNINPLCYDIDTFSNQRIINGNHGTHVAGIVAAIRNNGIFAAGVAPDSELVSISTCLNRLHPYTTEKIANGFNWAIQNNIDIINCSWGWGKYEIITDAIDLALNNGRNGKGCVIICATGNDSISQVSFPANYKPEILAVGSITKYGERSTFSNYGVDLDILAPGDTIFSTIPNNSASYMYGTSMAAPHVTGIAALILELNPDLTGQEVRDILEQSTTKLGNILYDNNSNRPNGTWNQYYGYGLVDALKAVQNTPRKQIDY